MTTPAPRPIPPPRRLLVVPLRFVGDAVLTIPLIRALRRHFPHARLEAMASSLTRPLLASCPYLDAVWEEPRGFWAQSRAMRRFDTVFSLRKSFTLALAAKLAGVSTVVGYDKQRFPAPIGYRRWALALDRVARYPSLRTQTPQAQSHLGLLHACALPAEDASLELWESPEDHAAVAEKLRALGVDADAPRAVFHAVSASHGKSFPPETFIPALESALAAGFSILCMGTAEDRPFYATLAARLATAIRPGRWAVLAGETTLLQTAALCRSAQLALTVDSGPMHLAAAVGTPHMVAVFGPTNERQWGPANAESAMAQVIFEPLPCRPCYAKTCAHNACRLTLDPARIQAAVLEAIAPAP